MDSNLIKSVFNSIWSAFDNFASIPWAINEDFAITPKGLLTLFLLLAIITPFILYVFRGE